MTPSEIARYQAICDKYSDGNIDPLSFAKTARTGFPAALIALREMHDAFESMRDEILNAEANMLNNDQINYVLGIVDSALPAPPAQNAAQGGEG